MTNIYANDLRVVEPLFFDVSTIQHSTSPKQLDVHVINVHLACALNRDWHSRFPEIHWSNVVRNKRYVCFAASYNGLYYASAIWSSPVAANRLRNGHLRLELRRMAIADDAPRNTASRMLREMRRWVHTNFEEITVLISYQDKDVHHGTIYKADNWCAVHEETTMTRWDTGSRVRALPQSTSPKVRWEFRLRPEPINEDQND